MAKLISTVYKVKCKCFLLCSGLILPTAYFPQGTSFSSKVWQVFEVLIHRVWGECWVPEESLVPPHRITFCSLLHASIPLASLRFWSTSLLHPSTRHHPLTYPHLFKPEPTVQKHKHANSSSVACVFIPTLLAPMNYCNRLCEATLHCSSWVIGDPKLAFCSPGLGLVTTEENWVLRKIFSNVEPSEVAFMWWSPWISPVGHSLWNTDWILLNIQKPNSEGLLLGNTIKIAVLVSVAMIIKHN